MNDETMHYMRPKGKGLALHIGCGDYWREGAINIDMNIYGGTDMLWDIRKGLPFQNEVISIIEAYEVVEHFNKYEIDEILKDWYRVLIPSGIVRISVPDMDGLVSLYASDPRLAIAQIYGIEDHPHHKQGYTVDNLVELFAAHGFLTNHCKQGLMENRPNEPKVLYEGVKK